MLTAEELTSPRRGTHPARPRFLFCEVAPAQPTVSYRVGMRVPETAQLYEMPETVAVEVPAIRSYKYMMVNTPLCWSTLQPVKWLANSPTNVDVTAVKRPGVVERRAASRIATDAAFTLPRRG